MSSNRINTNMLESNNALPASSTRADSKLTSSLSTTARIILQTLREESELSAPGDPISETEFFFKYFHTEQSDTDAAYTSYLKACTELGNEQLIKRYRDGDHHYIIDSISPAKRVKFVAVKEEFDSHMMQENFPTFLSSTLCESRSVVTQIEAVSPVIPEIKEEFFPDSAIEFDQDEAEDEAANDLVNLYHLVDTFFASAERVTTVTLANPKTTKRVNRKRKR
jgi:hypothetical protein